MGVRVMALAGLQHPVPDLQRARGLDPGEQHRAAALRCGPEGHRLLPRDQPDRRALVVVEQPGDADAERVGDPDHGPDAGIGTRLLDLDEHPPADTGPGGEGVQGQRPVGAEPSDVAGKGLGDQIEVGHEQSSPGGGEFNTMNLRVHLKTLLWRVLHGSLHCTARSPP